MMYELLNGYSYYKEWSPWVARDPNAEFITSGPESGIGARLSWIGEPQLVGSGWQEIVATMPYERIDIKLDFDAQGVADTGFILTPLGESSEVTWFFDSDLTKGVNWVDSFLARYFGLLFDRWVGGDYETGLVNLKEFAESLPAADFQSPEIEITQLGAQDILFITAGSSQHTQDIATAMTAAYAEISTFMISAGISMAGQPMAITRSWQDGGYEFDAAIPVDIIPAALTGDIRSGQSPSGTAVRAVHHGSYTEMMPTYEKMAAYISAHGLKQGIVSWEHYITDPANTAEQDMITHVYIMLEGSSDSG